MICAKKVILVILFTLFMATVFALTVYYLTSPQVWYSGMHDSQCEGIDGCNCYERMVANEKKILQE